MNTLTQIYEKYAGVDATKGCDKGTVHSYIDVYEEVFAPYRLTAKNVIEIGVMGGHSLRMWEEYFLGSAVHGVDLCDQPHDGLADLRPMIAEGNHRIELFDATDTVEVEGRFSDVLFDVVIDDANHHLPDQLAIFSNFKHHVVSGGIYVIEDIEDIDKSMQAFLALGDNVRILDRRSVKGRFDDVLVVIGGW